MFPTLTAIPDPAAGPAAPDRLAAAEVAALPPVRGGRPAYATLPRLIAFDIDGTLMPTTGPMAPRTIDALRAVAAAGIEVVIATGRRQLYAEPLLAPIGLAPETILITSNGAVTRNVAGRTFDRNFLALETARDLCAVLRPFGGTTVYTFDRPGKGELVLESLARLHDRIGKWVDANLASIEEIDPLEDAFLPGEAPIQGMVCGTVEEMERAERHLLSTPYAAQVQTHRTEYVTRDLSILDILPQGCSKGTAIARLAARRGFARSEVMAVGDNWNDLEMLEWAGQPVLMANASPELLARAEAGRWLVTASNDDDGVALVMESLLARLGESVVESQR